MGTKDELQEKLKNIIRQISGKLDQFEGPLHAEYIIKGSGIIFCLSADNRTFTKVERGISVYIVDADYGTHGRALVYTIHGSLILIELDELERIGFD